jgi:hypothetical protein
MGTAIPSQGDDGWSAGVSPLSGSNGAATPAPAPGQGWLGGDSTSSRNGGVAADVDESSAGWLGDSRTAKVGQAPASDNGWLGGEDTAKAPSMTEMVDRAIGAEEADDFVDDSWVDEEVSHGEFDDLEVPEYIPPTPEVGGMFVKMLLVAALVLLVGGGFMFMKQEKKTPEQIKAEETAKQLDFARSSAENGKNYLKNGQPLLAIGPLEAAMTSLKTAGGSEEEILETKVDLARALMKAQEYEKAYDHWAALAKAPEKYRKEAKTGIAETSKLLRAEATADLVEAGDYIKAGESTSVIGLGESALKIFEEHEGTASQKGKAWGVIGRGYLNGNEYGKAKDALKKAQKLNPSGGYGGDLARIAAETAPQNYYQGGGGGYYSEPDPAPRSTRPVKIDASIGDGPSIPRGHRVSSGGRRSARTTSSSSSASSAPARTSAPVRRTAPAPTYTRPASHSSGGLHLHKKGVVPGY